MSDHTTALVPIESWPYSSPELRTVDRQIDVGLFAEALIYYDVVYLNITNQPQLAEFIEWVASQRAVDDLVSLLEYGEVILYDYSFASMAVLVRGQYRLLNVQDQIQAKQGTFEARFIDHPNVISAMKPLNQASRLRQALSTRAIEVKSGEFGSSISNAMADFETPEKAARIVQAFIDEMREHKSGELIPDVAAKISDLSTGARRIEFDIDFGKLSDIAGEGLSFTVGTPMAGAALSTRFLWSSAIHDCDLFLGSPMATLVRYKLDEGSKYQSVDESNLKTLFTLGQLQAEVEFPNVRQLVNDGQLSLREVLLIRGKSGRFRRWLQQGADRDRNEIIAYHNEVAKETGFQRGARHTLRAFGAIGGAAAGFVLGAGVGGVPGAVVGSAVGSGLGFLTDLGSRLDQDWRPVVFGKWLADRTARLQ